MQNLPITLFTIGSVSLIIVLITGWVIVPLTIRSILEKEIYLGNGSIIWEEWQNPEQETYLKIYIFNVTNPNEILSGGEPLLEEIGPYFYMEKREKRIIQENVENDTVRYAEAVTYYFNEELSNGTDDDVFTTLNIPYLAVAQQLSTYSTVTRWLALTYIMKFKSQVFVEQTVREYIFTGIYQPMVHEIETLSDREILPNSTFGIFYGRNGTEVGEVEIYSGIMDTSRIGNIITWNGKTDLDYWTIGTHCNMINGSDGSLFSPFATKESTLYIYNPDLCRSIYLKYKKEVEIMGIPGYQYTPPADLANANDPDNRCFCPEIDFDQCPKSGVYPIKSCRKDAPLLISFPHFLDGVVEYSKKFGLTPNEDLHGSQVNLEPMTGAPLLIHKRMQINADVKRLPHVTRFKSIQDMVFPLLWMQETYIIKEENAALLRGNLITPFGIMHSIKWFAFGCSIIFISTSIFIFVLRVRRKPVFV